MKSILIIGMIAILGFYFYKGDQTAPKAEQDFKTMMAAILRGLLILIGLMETSKKWQKQWTNPRPIIYIVQQEEEAERQWII